MTAKERKPGADEEKRAKREEPFIEGSMIGV